MSITKSIQWLYGNYKTLQEKYSGKYVVVFEEHVIAIGDSVEEVDSKAKLIVPKDNEFLIEFIERGDLYAYYIRVSSNSSRA